ncbi:hypothetical protein HHK36_020119 [Tetracentron sinense]|uniref:Plastid division protein CDP1, chloroplastic n=1 Tax=Tetracentron sinense TaxID=13715 RepID=A0A835D7R4_TETSI|nr:hypothetical protein HHK36_020119 [Tetracentron sinense]
MALTHFLLRFPAYCCCRCIFLEEQRYSGSGVVDSVSSPGNPFSRVPVGFFPAGFRSRHRNVAGGRRLNVTKLQTVENNQIRRALRFRLLATRSHPRKLYIRLNFKENSTGSRIMMVLGMDSIWLTEFTICEIVDVSDQAEKDEIVKSVMDLKSAEIEEGYTLDAVLSHKDLLTDVRDKLLFEQEYAGNAKEKVPPKSMLRIPWAWLPGALCLLQEAGEEKLVLEIGRAALQRPDAKPYFHDLLLCMALAECAIAKISFEKSNASQGFEALGRAQYLLRSKISLEKMPLLSQIYSSLHCLKQFGWLWLLDRRIFGGACTCLHIGVTRHASHTPENSERRRRAIAALCELLRQGLDLETSCRVQDWPCFLSQALNKLMATEIVDLLPWDNLAITRKNKKSLESQNQRVVIDFNCFYSAVIAHIALGFSSKQRDLVFPLPCLDVNKAKTICECLVASEGIDLKFEEALCSFLLGQGDEAEGVERLQQLEINSRPASRNFVPAIFGKDIKDDSSSTPSLPAEIDQEMWLTDAVLSMFPDTQDCSPSLVNFFGGEKRAIRGSWHNKGSPQTIPSISHTPPSFVLVPDHRASEESVTHLNSTRHLGPAIKQLAPANLQSSLMAGKTSSGSSIGTQFVQLKRNLGSHHNKAWESWWGSGNVVGRITLVTVLGCFAFTTFKMLSMQFRQMRSVSGWNSAKPKVGTSTTTLAWSTDPSLDHNAGPACIDGRNIGGRLRKLLAMFKKQLKNSPDARTMPDDPSPFTTAVHKRLMPIEEAEALIEQWQAIKAEALGPSHHDQILSEVLVESMLSQWHALADSAKARPCFWRFILLQMSVLRANIILDEIGGEMAEIDAVLEETAELVDESQPKNSNYYRSPHNSSFSISFSFSPKFRPSEEHLSATHTEAACLFLLLSLDQTELVTNAPLYQGRSESEVIREDRTGMSEDEERATDLSLQRASPRGGTAQLVGISGRRNSER